MAYSVPSQQRVEFIFSRLLPKMFYNIDSRLYLKLQILFQREGDQGEPVCHL